MWQSLLAGAVLLAVGANGMKIPHVPVPTSALRGEGIIPRAEGINSRAEGAGGSLDRTGWEYTADSSQDGNPASYAMDNDANTIWSTEFNPELSQLPHTMTIDMKGTKNVDGVRYIPRQDGSSNGNIGQHKIYTSADCQNFGDPVAYGTWFDDATNKDAAFELHPARCVRIVAITEAGGRGPWTSAAGFEVYGGGDYHQPNPAAGLWGPTINMPLIPAAAAVEPDTGNLLAWSAYAYNTFGWNVGKTQTATWDFGSKIVSPREVTETQHDMFCPGISIDANGRVVITGGDTSQKTSIYSAGAGSWAAGSDMQIPRGYQSQVTLGDGRIFTIGGSWSGALGGKDGEIYDPGSNSWTKLNCPVQPMLTDDAQGVYRSDNHAWLFNWKNKAVFQAGPSKQMNWYSTDGNGGQTPAGNRANDGHSMCGNAVMYDATAGKILSVGGSPSYQGTGATANAHIITIGDPDKAVDVVAINPMFSPRIFQNSVVLPSGEVFITGGQTIGSPFQDSDSILTPEIYNPGTGNFYQMTPNSIPRNYHSIALLLIDATVVSCGGGLCNDCSTNHFDCQIFTPAYLLNGDGSLKGRPTIDTISSKVNVAGATIDVTTGGGPISSFAMIRYGSATHTTNTDQRRIPITPFVVGVNSYKVTLGPADVGVVTPGFWMLFAINGGGVPSVATTIQISA